MSLHTPEPDQTQEAGLQLSSTQPQPRPKKTAKARAKEMFSSRRLALMAIFTALSFLVSLLEFPVFPNAEFLKLDFGNVFIMLIGFLLGPAEGVIVCALKETIRITVSSTGGVGELANIIVTSSFLLLPSIAYKFHKGLKTVVPSMIAACLIATGAALLANRYILFPAFGFAAPAEVFQGTWSVILGFNLIKTASVSVLTLLLYKRLSTVLKKMKI